MADDKDLVEETVEEELDSSESDGIFAEFAGGRDEPGTDDEELVADDGEVAEEPEIKATDEAPAEAVVEEVTLEKLLAAAPEKARKEFEALQAELATQRHKASSDSARVSALQKKLNQVTAAQGEKVIPVSEVTKAFASRESWKEYEQYHPETAAMIKGLMDEFAAATESNLKPLQETSKVVAVKANEDAYKDAEQELTKDYPEWKSWLMSSDWYDWHSKLPASMRVIMDEGSFEESKALIGSFENYMLAKGKFKKEPLAEEGTLTQAAKLQEKRSKQLEAGATTPAKGGSAKPISESSTDDLFNYYVESKRK